MIKHFVPVFTPTPLETVLLVESIRVPILQNDRNIHLGHRLLFWDSRSKLPKNKDAELEKKKLCDS